jgi:dTMP kinase
MAEGSNYGSPAANDKSDKTSRGKFIVIDGPDFCGKGTQCSRLVAYLMSHPGDRHKQYDVWHTREPWHSEQGKRIRELLETANAPTLELGKELTRLYIEDRRQHLLRIMPLLQSGTHVVCDRYMYSTIAYQGAQGVPVHDTIPPQQDFLVPDLSIIIELPVAESLRRKAAARDRPYDEVFEKSAAFATLVHTNYAQMADWLPWHNIAFLNGDQSKDDVALAIQKQVDELLQANSKR